MKKYINKLSWIPFTVLIDRPNRIVENSYSNKVIRFQIFGIVIFKLIEAQFKYLDNVEHKNK